MCLPVGVAVLVDRGLGVALQPEEGGFSVLAPALPGCHTQGETREEALAMAKDAIEGYLEVLIEQRPSCPGWR